MLVVALDEKLAKRLQQAAAEAGLTPDHYVAKALEVSLARAAIPGRLSKSEAQLLEEVNAGFAHIPWQRYLELLKRRDLEYLTDAEQQELIDLSDGLESANVKRLRLLVELAELRKTSLPNLIKELGLVPVVHG
jgi:hypothetical protein